MSAEHVTAWNDLDRHHRENAIDAFIDAHRPKEIHRYKENGHVIRVFEPAFADECQFAEMAI